MKNSFVLRASGDQGPRESAAGLAGPNLNQHIQICFSAEYDALPECSPTGALARPLPFRWSKGSPACVFLPTQETSSGEVVQMRSETKHSPVKRPPPPLPSPIRGLPVQGAFRLADPGKEKQQPLCRASHPSPLVPTDSPTAAAL